MIRFNQDKGKPLTEQEEQDVLQRIRCHQPPQPSPQFSEKLRQKLKHSVQRRRRQSLLMRWGTGIAVALVCLLLITPFGKTLMHDSISFVHSTLFKQEEMKPVVIPEFPQEDADTLPTDHGEMLVPINAKLEEAIASHDYLQRIQAVLRQTIDLGAEEGTPEFDIAPRSFTYYHAAIALKDIELLKSFTWGSIAGFPEINYDERIAYYHDVMVKETLEIVSIKPSMAEPDYWITMRYQDKAGHWYTTEYILSLSYAPSIYSVLDETLTHHQELTLANESIVVLGEDTYLGTNQLPVTAPFLDANMTQHLPFVNVERVNKALESALHEAANKVIAIDEEYPEEKGELELSYTVLHDTYPYLSLHFYSSIVFPTVNQGRPIGFNTYIIYDLETDQVWTVENILKEITLPVTDSDEFSYQNRMLSYFDYKYQRALELNPAKYLEGYLDNLASFSFNHVQQVYLEDGQVNFYIGDYIYGTHVPQVIKLHELQHVLIEEVFLKRLHK